MVVTTGLLVWTLRIPSIHMRLSDTNQERTRRPTISFDFAGNALLITAIVVPSLALNLGGAILPWNHPVIIILLLSTLLIVGALIYVERKVAKSPVIPTQLLESASVLSVIFCNIPVSFASNQVCDQIIHHHAIWSKLFASWCLVSPSIPKFDHLGAISSIIGH